MLRQSDWRSPPVDQQRFISNKHVALFKIACSLPCTRDEGSIILPFYSIIAGRRGVRRRTMLLPPHSDARPRVMKWKTVTV
jgi:hypothetical protein